MNSTSVARIATDLFGPRGHSNSSFMPRRSLSSLSGSHRPLQRNGEPTPIILSTRTHICTYIIPLSQCSWGVYSARGWSWFEAGAPVTELCSVECVSFALKYIWRPAVGKDMEIIAKVCSHPKPVIIFYLFIPYPYQESSISAGTCCRSTRAIGWVTMLKPLLYTC